MESSGPRPRAGHSMAYDTTRNRTVLFGGTVGDALVNDTWEWDGQSWRENRRHGAVFGAKLSVTA
jgi:hypothetical protein